LRYFIGLLLLALAACAPEEAAHIAASPAYADRGCARAAAQRVADALSNGIPRSYSRRIFDDVYAGCVGQRNHILVGLPSSPAP
jgi:hypothetical protein